MGKNIKSKIRELKIWQLIVLLLVVVFSTVFFVGLSAGWFFNQKAKIDAEYSCNGDCDYMELSASSYEKLIEDKKSFVVFIDQGGCTTADRLRGFVADYMQKFGVKVYRMMFETMKETSLHNFVKYYPSVAVISKGRVVGFLRADADDDANAYNNYDVFLDWMNRYILF